MKQDKTINIKCEAKSYFQLEELIPFQGKLKSIDKKHFKDLKDSLIKDGLPLGFHVWKDSKDKVFIIDGHHRQLALKALQDEGYHIPALPCTVVFAKNKKEAAKAVLISNSKYANISPESLSDFMIDFELGLDDLQFLDITGLDMDDFAKDAGKEGKDEENFYTDNIKAPIYTPKGEKPKITELFDLTKTNILLEKINQSELPKKEKEFLSYAAQRHIVFNYKSIAEFYCHASKEAQDLMEDSALVIIDFNKAVENGFVKLTQDLAEACEDEE
jgi:hypothetical protein